MVRIRLQRHGRKKLPFYHIVAADVRSKRDGRIIEDLGRYLPTQEPSVLKLETERVIYWLKNGAQPSETVRSILKKEGVYYRLHLERWGKSEEEIEETIDGWKKEKDLGMKKTVTKADRMKAQLKTEEEKFLKEQKAREAEEIEKRKAAAEAEKEDMAEEKTEQVAAADTADEAVSEAKEAVSEAKEVVSEAKEAVSEAKEDLADAESAGKQEAEAEQEVSESANAGPEEKSDTADASPKERSEEK